MRAQKWDYVVLQEYTLTAIDPKSSTREYAKKFDAEIKAQGGKTLFYAPWGWKTKGLKTRNNKRTDSFIVRRRNTKG